MHTGNLRTSNSTRLLARALPLALALGCSACFATKQPHADTLPSTALASSKQDINPLFDGEWTYTKKCDFGHFVNITFKQVENDVFGEWSEGTSLRGSDGLLKGTMRDGKLFVQYCSQDGEKGYRACPEYGDEVAYFIRQGDDLVRYQKFGNEYSRDIVLHRDGLEKQLLIDDANCQGEIE